MGAAMCGLRKRSSKWQQNQENEAHMVRNTWPKCLGKPKKKKKTKPGVLTLQDFIVPSPHSNKGRVKSLNTNKGNGTSKRVFRSQVIEATIKLDKGDVRVVEERISSWGENGESSSRRVRFTLPPLGDIIAVDSRYRVKLANSNNEVDISQRVFPSPAKDHREAISSNSIDNLGSDRYMDRAVKLNVYADRVVDERILSRSEDKESPSKRVKFKLPSLRDIMVIDSKCR